MIRSVHLVVTSPEGMHAYFRRDAERLQDLLAAPDCGVRVEADPAAADAIVFVGSSDPALVDVRRHALFARFPEKCLVLHGGDEPLPSVPGIYASVPRRWYDPKRHRAGFYLRTALDGSIDSAVGSPAAHLFSFVGAIDNHPVRGRFPEFRAADALIVDSRLHPVPHAQARERFVRSVRDSLFVLCPRGGGTSSFRIFETMKAGRVPVILSDDWVEPMGPDWSACAVRVPEAEVSDIPGRLGELRERAPDMGACARDAWERWFSAATAGPTLVGWIEELLETSREEGPYRLPWAMRLRYSLRASKHLAKDRLRRAEQE